ncbi:MAG: hypothetical protein M1828_004553 [Chrysothrix sp. TS-e1954]|nr:MAG: hypothetical protein M1828_004553 [Chrysothrix sp. TS-e1954]
MGSLISGPPADFNGRSAVYHSTPDYEAACVYARFKVNVGVSHAEVRIVRIAVPNRMISAAMPLVMTFPSDEWKQTIWLSRRSQKLQDKALIAKGKTLLIGDAATGVPKTYCKLESWEHVTQQHVLRLDDGSKMCQYVFGDEFAEQIEENCAGSTTILDYHRKG